MTRQLVVSAIRSPATCARTPVNRNLKWGASLANISGHSDARACL